jgi:hypothetical protein
LKIEVATNSPNLVKFISTIKEEADKKDLKPKLLSKKQALEQMKKGNVAAYQRMAASINGSVE